MVTADRKFVLDEAKYVAFIQKKLNDYYAKSQGKFRELNPDFEFKEKLTKEQQDILQAYQLGNITIDQISPEDFEKLKVFMESAKSIEEQMIKGELKVDMYTFEEIVEMFSLTEDEFRKSVINYGEEELVQKSES